MTWDDPEILGRVIDERLVASQGGAVTPADIWKRFFVANVRGVPANEYFVGVVLPRPRDLVFFVKSAITTAINRGHTVVQEEDVLEAEKRYSAFAVEILSVENTMPIARLDDVLLAFLGRRTQLGHLEVVDCIGGAGVEKHSIEQVIDQLCALAFLGLEVRPGEFDFAHDPLDRRRLLALARKVTSESGKEQQFAVHPAFWSYLEMHDDPDRPWQMKFAWNRTR
jgi:hypothetical protein